MKEINFHQGKEERHYRLFTGKFEENENAKNEIYEEVDEFIEQTVVEWYKVSVRRGVIEM